MMVTVVVCLLAAGATAQTKDAKKKPAQQTSVVKKERKAATTTSSTSLNNTGRYSAFAADTTSALRISDPTINRLNMRAAGANLPGGSGIVGMPKGSYGFANGRILLRTTTATTPGTAYGSGAVGTGTSLLGAGTSEAALGVNGKSPYAGPWLWGDKRPVYPVAIDSGRRRQ